MKLSQRLISQVLVASQEKVFRLRSVLALGQAPQESSHSTKFTKHLDSTLRHTLWLSDSSPGLDNPNGSAS